MGFEIPQAFADYPLAYGIIITLIAIVLVRIINSFYEADPMGNKLKCINI